METWQRLVLDTAADGRDQDLFGGGDFTGDEHLLGVEQVDRDGDGAPQVLPYVLDHAAGQLVTGHRRLAHLLDGDVLLLQRTQVTAADELLHLVDDGLVGGDGLEAAEVAAVAALAERFDLDVAYFTDVAVLAEKHLALGDDARSRPLVDTHQDGVHAVAGLAEEVFGQRQRTGVVAHVAGEVEVVLQELGEPQVADLVGGGVDDHAGFRVDQTRHGQRDADEVAAAILIGVDEGANLPQQHVHHGLLLDLGHLGDVLIELLAVEVIQGELQVAATQLGGHKLEAMLDGGQGDGAAPASGGLRRGFPDETVLDQLPGYLGHAGRGQLTQLGNFDPRDGPLQVNEAIDDRTVYLLDKIYVCYLSASHSVTVLCSVR